jgi:hypothetical protein
VTLNIIDCTILPVDLLSWNGKVQDNQAQLKWVTENESEPIVYEVERSSDAINFVVAGTVPGKYVSQPSGFSYNFTDPQLINGNTFYRLKIISQSSSARYSQVILLSNGEVSFEAKPMMNPFHSEIKLNLYVPDKSRVRFKLLDTYGRVLLQKESQFDKGLNSFSLSDLGNMCNGVYFLNIQYRDLQLNHKLIRH